MREAASPAEGDSMQNVLQEIDLVCEDFPIDKVRLKHLQTCKMEIQILSKFFSFRVDKVVQ